MGDEGMGTASIFHWVVLIVPLVVLVLTVIPLIRILERLGLSPGWAVLYFVPIGNIIGLWLLAKADWPKAPDAKVERLG